MRFDELDQKMRVFETAHDHSTLPEMYMVARLDGRSFTRLTKELHAFEAPFDLRFHQYMLDTAEHLMNCGLRVVYAYTQSDEISLLLHRDESSFGRKHRKLGSVLSGEASGKFSLALGRVACFDGRICEFPNSELVVDYFRWRHEDAHRNALNGHCYWALREEMGPQQAAAALAGLSVSAKNELLFQKKQLNFNDLPQWQKRGSGLYWEAYDKESFDPSTEQAVRARRQRVHREMNLPMKDEYSLFVRERLADAESEAATAT